MVSLRKQKDTAIFVPTARRQGYLFGNHFCFWELFCYFFVILVLIIVFERMLLCSNTSSFVSLRVFFLPKKEGIQRDTACEVSLILLAFFQQQGVWGKRYFLQTFFLSLFLFDLVIFLCENF